MPKRYLISIMLLLVAMPFVCSSAFAELDALSETEARAAQAKLSPDSCLTPQARQLADELGLRQLADRLHLLSEHEKHKHGTPMSPESTTLRLEIDEVVITSILQCQEVIAQIEAEISESYEVKSALEGKRDKAIKTNSRANIFGNGLLAGGGDLLQMPFETNGDSRTELFGESVEGTGGLFAAFLGGYALHQNNGMKLSTGIEPNMLAKVFKRPTDADNEYPDVIWRYLNSVPPGSKNGATRRQLLIMRWEALGRIPPQNTVKGRLYIRTLAGTIPENKTLTISLLDDRLAMLGDLRAEVSQIYKELLNVMLLVRAL